jgi:YVTN family beta-propeller protein
MAIPERTSVLMFAAMVMFTAAAASSPGDLPLRRIADVPLGGHTTRLDYESIDSRRHLLFIAHLGDSEVIVFDTQSQRVVSRIANVRSVHGVLVIAELGKVYASATGSNEVVAIDENSLRITSRTPGGIYPDGMAYAPDAHKLYVADEHGNTMTVIDVNTDQRVTTIPLGGEVGNVQYDASSKHVFANVQTRHELAEIDTLTDKLVARIDLPGAEGNHGLLIDSARRRAFIACEDNDKLLVLNLDTKKVEATFAVGKDPDVLAFDPRLERLYVASESGIVSLFAVAPGPVSKLGEGLLGPHAHVVAVDPATQRSYFPLMNQDGQTVLRIMDTH